MKSLGGRKIKKINQARSRLPGGMQPEDYFRSYRGMAASVLWRKKLGKRAILAGQKLFYLLVFVHCSEGVVVLWRVLEAQFVTCTAIFVVAVQKCVNLLCLEERCKMSTSL